MVRVQNASAGTSYIARPGGIALALLLAAWCALSGDVEAQAPRGGGGVKFPKTPQPGSDRPPNPAGPGAMPLGGAGGAQALGGPGVPSRPKGSPPTEQQIQAAIDRAVGHLLR